MSINNIIYAFVNKILVREIYKKELAISKSDFTCIEVRVRGKRLMYVQKNIYICEQNFGKKI